MSGPHDPDWQEVAAVGCVLLFPFAALAGFMVLAAVLMKWVIS